jgi:tetratricopeptide (TPR) repeat protein
MNSGDFGGAENVLLEAAQISKDQGQRLWTAWLGQGLGRVALRAGDPIGSRERSLRALELFSQMRHRYGAAHCRLLLGEAYLEEYRPDDAASFLEDALETFQSCGDPWIAGATLKLLAQSKRDRSQTDEAIHLFEAAGQIFSDVGDQKGEDSVRVELATPRMRWRRLLLAGRDLSE